MVVPVTLDIGRAYSAGEAAAILGITTYVLNERLREGWLKPVFESGDRRYSGYALAQLLGWELSVSPREDLIADVAVSSEVVSGPRRRVRTVR